LDVPFGARIDVVVRMNTLGQWINNDCIEHHISNNGKMSGDAIMVVEYEDESIKMIKKEKLFTLIQL